MRAFILYTRGTYHPRVSYNLHKAHQHTFNFYIVIYPDDTISHRTSTNVIRLFK